MPRIGCLQFAPQVGDVSNNLNRADAVLSRADPVELDNLDLLVLPEMAFSGYNFKSLDHIMPYLEPSGSGISALWARTTALKYDCTVAVGYPEKVDSSRRVRGSGPKYHNSLIVVNGDGETMANYRKTFLYYTDATWAQEGSGFYGGKIDGLGKVAMGICMDINPYKFEAPWDAYEFGFHIVEVKANLVIMSMAWLTLQDRTTFTPFSQEPDMETLTYWVQRLEPVIRSEQKEEIIVVFCNRCGIEDDVVYAGTSAVIGVKNGEVSVYGLLGRGVKELLIVNTDLLPFAKLVDRSDNTETKEETVASAEPSSGQVSPALVSPAKMSPAKPSPKKERLGRLPEAEEPFEEPLVVTSPVSSLGSRGSQGSQPQSPPMVEVAPPGPVIRVFGQAVANSQLTIEPQSEDQQKDSTSKRCLGNCDGCDEHIFGGMSDVLDTPVFPSPTPVSVRPKLAISTGPRSLPPLSTKAPPRGSQPGNFFTSRDLCTPPMTAIDDDPMTAVLNESLISPSRYLWNHPQAFPPSARLITPEEPVWPAFEMATIADSKRASRAPLPKPEARAEMGGLPRSPSRLESKVPARPPSRLETRLPIGPTPKPDVKLSTETPLELSAGDAQALGVAVQEAGLFNKVDIPIRPSSPKSRNASRDASKDRSRASSRNTSRAVSKDRSLSGSRTRSRNTSKCAGRNPSREASREPSRNPSRNASRNASRETSRVREDETISPVHERRSLHSEPSQVRGRGRSGRAQSTSPAGHTVMKAGEKESSLDRGRKEQTAGHKSAKTLLTAFKGSIPIAASPSVFETSFGDSELLIAPRPPPQFGHSRLRSKSASSVMTPFQHPLPRREQHRMTADFSSLWSSRERSARRDDASPMEPGNPGRGNSLVPSVDELHPGIKALMVTEDEAFLGRTLWRAESWRRKREPRRTRSGSRERQGSVTPVERIQPTFFF